MKRFIFVLIAWVFLFSACNSNEKQAKENCTKLWNEVVKADQSNMSEQAFFTELNGLKVDRDRLVSLVESKESVDREVISDLQSFMDEFSTISQQKKTFKENSKIRKKFMFRLKKLKHDMDNGLGKKETYTDKLHKEEKNWKMIQNEYLAMENTLKDLHTKFGKIRQNLIQQ